MPSSILVFSTIQGHASIGEALQEYFVEQKIESKVNSDVYPGAKVYRWFYRHAPSMSYLFYKLVSIPAFYQFLSLYLQAHYSSVVQEKISRYKPQVVISTSYGYDQALNKAKKKNTFLYVNVIVDPLTFFSPCLSTSADFNCVFDNYQQNYCTELNSTAKTKVTGWFVRKKFEAEYEQKKVRQGLQIDPDLFTILFVCGSEGETRSSKLLPALLRSTVPVQIIVACGNNKKLRQDIEQKIRPLMQNSSSRLICLPFTSDIYKYMQAADVIVGKAGPNTVFEATATLTPFLAVSHISGQEDGNLEIIKKYNLGYVEENLEKAAELLQSIVANPTQLDQFKESIQKMANYNQGSKKKLVEHIQELQNLQLS
jgi:processive 1,2-diacylglycerol beta-glucosyltransferase